MSSYRLERSVAKTFAAAIAVAWCLSRSPAAAAAAAAGDFGNAAGAGDFGNAADPDQPFWVDPCGYGSNDDGGDDGGPGATVDRVLTLADRCQRNVDRFKRDYVRRTFGADYDAHYRRWAREANEWMTPRLLETAEDDLPRSWLDGREYPGELAVTYDVLQRAAVGFEMLTDDAAVAGTAENAFADMFDACRADLRQLLCEVSDDVDANGGADADGPRAVGRDAIPDDVRHDASAAGRNLTNSIVFRDYMIAVKYVTEVYGHFKARTDGPRANAPARNRTVRHGTSTRFPFSNE